MEPFLGMPLTLLNATTTTLAAVYNDYRIGSGEPGVTPNEEQISAELGRLRFYLRTNVDTDGTTLYRLFHQGLADYLQALSEFTKFQHPPAQAALTEHRVAGLIFDSMLEAVPAQPSPKKSLYGLWANYAPGPSEQEIDENRREMFREFAEGDL